ncbi:unnamed protein product [Citrullus colocynthis]|uniref:Oxysterol-binding protein-related protein 4C-like n=1 Tax=Citrullus colocynthis TaxID=252529 RepID=A0ABP0YZ52_9ROSI
MSLEEESDADRASNLFRQAMTIIKDLRPGLDLITLKYKAPPNFNIPKSHLQCFGESVYCSGEDMLGKCNAGGSALERLAAVVGWSISTTRPLIFGAFPYNPILGETHHVSRGTLNVLLEQVSHHPPVAALHATDETHNIEMIWCHHLSPKYRGTSVETEMCGKREVKLLNHGETYVMNCPSLVFKFIPTKAFEWSGKVKIQCQETALTAEISYKGLSFLGRKSNSRSINGNIFPQSSLSTKNLGDIDGQWDRSVTLKYHNGNAKVIYNANEVISNLKTPVVVDPKGVKATESAKVWGEVSQGILSKDWKKAKKAKMAVEERQRELAKERESRKQTWVPKHFKVSYSKENGWDCSPIQPTVPPAPIVVPI